MLSESEKINSQIAAKVWEDLILWGNPTEGKIPKGIIQNKK